MLKYIDDRAWIKFIWGILNLRRIRLKFERIFLNLNRTKLCEFFVKKVCLIGCLFDSDYFQGI